MTYPDFGDVIAQLVTGTYGYVIAVLLVAALAYWLMRNTL